MLHRKSRLGGRPQMSVAGRFELALYSPAQRGGLMKIAVCGALLALVALGGCVSEPAQKHEVKLNTPINSAERLKECAADWKDPHDGADCVRGKKYTQSEFCREAALLLGDRYASDWQKAALYEKARNHGCFR